jgi:acetyltransferase-like isoleucine patch superfamily enzyme
VTTAPAATSAYRPITQPGTATARAPRISRGAYIGAGTVVGQGMVVGELALVGMGAVVTRNVPAREVWAGVPARRMRDTIIPGEPGIDPFRD